MYNLRMIKFQALLLAIAAAIAVGCSTTGEPMDRRRAVAYRPDESGREVRLWLDKQNGGQLNLGTTTNGVVRVLRKGDRVKISLTGIPDPEELDNVINDFGTVTLPLIGVVKIEGMTTRHAEVLIQEAYIKKQFYKSINVIVVAQEGEFFVGGEVNKRGSLPLSGDITLTQAIIMAGDFTDFARKTKVELTHGKTTTVHNWEAIKDGKAEDPIIENGDTITVPRRPW